MPSRIAPFFPTSIPSSPPPPVIVAYESIHTTVANTQTHSSHTHFNPFDFELGFGVGAGTLILSLVLFLLLCLLKGRRGQNRALKQCPWGSVKLKHFAYRELKAATRGFDRELKLGQGGFGAVYKGLLKEGQEVAVKKLDAASFQGEKEFQNELSVIGHVCTSPHIVPLVGFCSNGKQRLLVYEYMPNHSLQEALFDEDYPEQLRWEQRFNIIMDTCRALAFLHACKPPIIHGDIKPSNVLLDAAFCAKVADFGLARFKTSTTTSTEPEDVFIETRNMEEQKLKCHRRSREKHRKDASMTSEASSITCVERVKVQQEPELANSESNVRKSTSTLFTTSPESDASSSLVGKLVCESSQNSTDGNVVLLDNHLSDSDMATSASPLPEAQDELLNPDGEFSVPPSTEGGSLDFMQENGPLEPEKLGTSCRNGVELVGGKWKKRKGAFGRDWWWKQEGSGQLSSKDYVMEWMGDDGSRRKASNNESRIAGQMARDQKEEREESRRRSLCRGSKARTEHSRSCDGWGSGARVERSFRQHEDVILQVDGRRGERQQDADAWSSLKKNGSTTLDGCTRANDARFGDSERSASLEWWRDDRVEGGWKAKSATRKERPKSREWWKDEDAVNSKEWKALKKKRERSLSREECSGELLSRGVSSTPSMRGTLCYVAPENGGSNVMPEKSDVYSFGVLLLVIISGRRPLQVMASPITQFERANLISWARHLAQSGDVLQLVDPGLQGKFCRKQATLSITVALLCLQRLPSKRPSMVDALKMLSGEHEVPPLPFHFSPSPPCRVPRRSHRCSSLSSEGVAIDFTFSS